MKLLYSYHSEHNANQQDRWVHFALFLAALGMVLAAAQQFYVHFSSWQTAGESAYWHLTLGIVYLVIAGVLTFLGVRMRNASQGDADRFVRVDEKHLIWDLTQIDGEQRVLLDDIERVDRKSIRDLEVTLRSQQNVNLPIYLIANHDKQEELLKVLWEIVPAK